jgi:Protein of unknown function (DUF2975)
MLKTPLRDPLLNGARILIYLAMAVLIFAVVMLGIGLGAIATVGRAELLAEFAKVGAPVSGVWLIALAMVLIIALLGCAFRFVQKLLEIVNSVGEGDPFDPRNADRLSAMGWLTLAGQALVLPLMAIAAWIEPYFEKAGKNSDFGFDFDLGTVLLILILFILARVFRKGADMRAELEGTV